MYRRQRGVTAIGWLFLLIPIAVVLYAGIRLTPVYLNYMKVARSLEQLQDSTSSSDVASAVAVRRALERYFDIEGIDFPSIEEIAVRREEGLWVVDASYEDAAPLFANISLTVQFDKSVTLQ
jgi:hypothetical protein